jgi:hypothetical protein
VGATSLPSSASSFSDTIRNARCHRKDDTRRLVNAAEALMHHVQRDGVGVVLDLLENQLVNCMKQREHICNVRLLRSHKAC